MPAQFSIYEINTWVWLSGLGETPGRTVDLSTVPAAEWDAIAAYGFDVVWLMGVWERSPAGRAIANRNPQLADEFLRCLPDMRPEDNVGSAYCVRRYVVDERLGGPEGLAVARQQLARRGMRLLLDYVPNHVAPDSPWITENPGHFMPGTTADLRDHPGAFLTIDGQVFACGRDPYFPPWPDVVQVNAFDPGHRAGVIQHLDQIAQQCDGVRCDMAMLLINDVFARTWGDRPGPMPADEYWPLVIQAVRRQCPQFLFIAEAYWDMEWTLQQQGFDFCYDKRLYDLVEHDDAAGVSRYLGAPLAFQQKLIRFLENHDEPRVAALYSPAKAQAAAILTATVPGARLFHEGQFAGRRIRIPVFLARRPEEPVDRETQSFYASLLAAIHAPVFREGEWVLCPCSGWPDNGSFQKLGAWCWSWGEDRRLVLINLSEMPVQARVHLPWSDLDKKQWRLADALSAASYDRQGSEMQSEGLYVALAPWSGQILSVSVI
jgi:hypothetical protein